MCSSEQLALVDFDDALVRKKLGVCLRLEEPQRADDGDFHFHSLQILNL